MKKVFRKELWAEDLLKVGHSWLVEAEKRNPDTWQKDCEGREVINNEILMPGFFIPYQIDPEWCEEVTE